MTQDGELAASGPGTDAHRALRIGITGPIGCGKSTVARWLRENGAAVIDADEEARAVTARGGVVLDAVFAHFGEAFRGADGGLDRAAMARLVFEDPAALVTLEAMVHPAVRRRIVAAIDAAEVARVPAVAIEAIKLFEGGLAELCDEVWLVDCRPATQRARLSARGLDPAEAERRIAAQGELAGRLRPRATRVLRTDGSWPRARRRATLAFELALRAHGAAPAAK